MMPGASHIGGTNHLLTGLKAGEYKEASHKGDPGKLAMTDKTTWSRQ